MNKEEMDAVNLKSTNSTELFQKILFLKKELFNLRVQKVLGELKNTSRFAKVRKSIARANTEIMQRKKNGEFFDA